MVLTVAIRRYGLPIDAVGGVNFRFGTFLEVCNLERGVCFVKAQ